MEIDSNYIQYLVGQAVAKEIEKALKPIYETQGRLTERYHNLKMHVDDITPESVKAPYGRDIDGKPRTKESFMAGMAEAAERYKNR